jgi:predicted amidohydrolase
MFLYRLVGRETILIKRRSAWSRKEARVVTRQVDIGVCQYAGRVVSGFEEFADHVREMLDQANGADLIVFPELFTVELFTSFSDWRETPISELTRVDQYTQAYRDLFESEARERGQFIAAGSHLMKENGRYLNVAHLFEPDGTIHTHEKTHIFPVEVEWSTEEADTLQVIDLPIGRVGFNICYEAEIPECADTLTEQGVEIVLSPSATYTEHGFWRVRHCAQARCIENQVYFVHSCSGGQPGDPLPDSWGMSSILSPCDEPWPANGVVAQATPNEEAVVRGVVDLDSLYEKRENSVAPTYRDRRRRAALYEQWPSHVRTAASSS